MEEIKSPCTGHCQYDYSTKICIGCFRSMDEIISWSVLNENEKKIVLQRAELRKNDKKGKSDEWS